MMKDDTNGALPEPRSPSAYRSNKVLVLRRNATGKLSNSQTLTKQFLNQHTEIVNAGPAYQGAATGSPPSCGLRIGVATLEFV